MRRNSPEPSTSQAKITKTEDVKVVNVEEAEKILYSYIESLQNSEIKDLSVTELRVLLEICDYDVSKLEIKLNSKKEEFLKQSGVSLKKDIQTEQSPIPADTLCPVCDQAIGSDVLALKCGHFACLSCYESYCRSIIENGESVVYCIQHDICNLLLDDSVVKQFLSEELTRQTRLKILNNYMKANQKKLIPCSTCGKIFHVYDSQSTQVNCDCGTNMCIGCKKESHTPATCKHVDIFLKLSDPDADEATKDWLSIYTKKCPNCGAFIEKTGGCNKVQCVSCQQWFCFLCITMWKKHDENCTTLAAVLNKNQAMELKGKEFFISYEQYNKLKHNANFMFDMEAKLLLRTPSNKHDEVHDYVIYLKESLLHMSATYIVLYFVKDEVSRNLLQYNLDRARERVEEILEILRNDKMEFLSYLPTRIKLLKLSMNTALSRAADAVKNLEEE